jgi:phosphoglycolate phosphatase-like HAD superfamily hydrolase
MPTDVDAAKNVGALSVAVATGIFPDEVKSRNPDFVIDSVADLPEVLPDILKKMPTLGSDGVRIKAL